MKANNYLRFDPERLRKLSRPWRDLAWSMPIRLGEQIAMSRQKDTATLIGKEKLAFHRAERGVDLPETAVTSVQMELLIESLKSVSSIPGEVAEIGSWRGVSTVALAGNTKKTVYAIDPHPFGAFEGVEEAFAAFEARIAGNKNIKYVRKCSGEAFRQCSNLEFSLVFVDAMHDFVNANFDVSIWSSLIPAGGLLAMHDVDDHPGVNLALQRVLKRHELIPWGYCPNLIVLKKCGLIK